MSAEFEHRPGVDAEAPASVLPAEFLALVRLMSAIRELLEHEPDVTEYYLAQRAADLLTQNLAIESAYVLLDLAGHVELVAASDLTADPGAIITDAGLPEAVRSGAPLPPHSEWIVAPVADGATAGRIAVRRLPRRHDPLLARGVELVARVYGAVLANLRGARDRDRALDQRGRDLERARDAADAGIAARTTFLANISHEVRTPLNGVLGMSALLLDTPLSTEQRRFALAISSSCSALLTLVEHLLDFSRIESGRMHLEWVEFDVRQLVTDLVTLLEPQARRKSLHLECEVDPAVPRLVRGDPIRLRQVLVNLASNAVKFTDDGTVRIALGCSTRDGRRFLDGTVTDTGIGIPADRLDAIFEQFVQADASSTRRFGGSGLGLTIARELAQLMDGDIEVDSTPGKGSTFRFRVALEPAPQGDAPRAAAPPASRRRTATHPGQPPPPLPLPLPSMNARLPTCDAAARSVLVVDGDPINRLVLCRRLERLGHVVRAVDTCGAAYDLAVAGQASLLLLDPSLPDGSGLDLARRIRSAMGRDAPPIVAITGLRNRDALADSRAAGLADHLARPVSTAQLATILGRFAIQPQGRPPPSITH